MKSTVLVFCLTLLNFGGVLPQQSSDWPPDPASLFTDAAKIIQADSEARSGLLVDTLNRQIVSDDGRKFPWPDEIEDIGHYTSHKPFGTRIIIDGNLYLQVAPRNDASRIWRLDLKTGRYAPLSGDTIYTQCGTIKLDDALVDTYPWVMQYRAKGWQFCKVTTGWLSGPLPPGYRWERSDSGPAPSARLSPDGAWMLLFGYRSYDEACPTVYAYAFKTGQLSTLGVFPDCFIFRYEQFRAEWLNNHTFLLHAEGWSEWSARDLYIADVTRTNSLELAIDGFRRAPILLDNPPRYETFFSPSLTLGEGHGCTRDIFDIQSRRKTTYSYPLSMCATEYGPVDGDGYYRDVSADQTSATLVRHNPVTLKRVELYRGEIEHILWVSPDEHYTALVLDDNGRIDSRPGWETLEDPEPAVPYVAVLDLSTGNMLYKMNAQHLSSWASRRGAVYSSPAYAERIPFFWFPYVEQVTPNLLLLIDAQATLHREAYGLTFSLLHIENRRVMMSDIPIKGDVAASKPGDGRLLIWTDGEDKSTALSLYDPVMGKVTPLIKANDRYAGFLLEADAQTLTVVVTPRGQDQDNFLHKMTYKLQLPG